MPPFQCSRVALHLPLRWRCFRYCTPVRYAARVSTIAPSCGDAGRVGAAISALAPQLPALPQKHNTPANVNRDSSRSPALLAAPIRRRRIRQRFGVTLVGTAHPPAVAQRQHRDKPLPQVHGALDGTLAAARLAQRLEEETHRIVWGTVVRRVGGEYMLRTGRKRKFPDFAPSSESLQDLTPKIIRRANGRISGATVPIECTEFVETLDIGPNWHAHTKKALKTNNFVGYSTSESTYEVHEPLRFRKCQNSRWLKK
ncbi:hypothetical protein B0H14DRAFT_3138710 [Mycena olivaceomarginata]|nr:hypothetical protein B0H14DRAFT_3138710 [Mycena olivaceomarginata]